MKRKQKNILYTACFDGHILNYHSSGFARWLLGMLGFCARIEIPINTVLSYKMIKAVPGLTFLKLTKDKYKFGSSKPNPITIRTLFLLGPRSSLVAALRNAVDRSIEEGRQGINVGLLHIDTKSLRSYYDQTMPSARDRTRKRPKLSQRRSLNDNCYNQPVIRFIKRSPSSKLIA